MLLFWSGILEHCDCFISLYAPLSLEYVWSATVGVFNGEKIWSVVVCVCTCLIQLLFTISRQLIIYIFLGPFPFFLPLSKARPRIFNNSYQDLLAKLFFRIVWATATVLGYYGSEGKVSKYWTLMIWHKIKLSFQLSNTAKYKLLDFYVGK